MEYINYLLIVLFIFYILNRIIPAKGIKHISTVDLKNELKDKK